MAKIPKFLNNLGSSPYFFSGNLMSLISSILVRRIRQLVSRTIELELVGISDDFRGGIVYQ